MNNLLGEFLKERRARLDPTSFGFKEGRRRTPGLRREEVAQLANVSPTWYTWIEQSRGGSPSKEVLNRIATALKLKEPEREYLFFLAFGHPPESQVHSSEDITPRLQQVLDSLSYCPAIIKTAMWDVVAWNTAATMLLSDYNKIPKSERNTLRFIFTNPRSKRVQQDWASVAQFVVSTFRADITRLGIADSAREFIDELSSASAEFDELWRSHEVRGHGGGVKRLLHQEIGAIDFAYSTFIVEDRPDLNMVIFNPANPETFTKIKAYLDTAITNSLAAGLQGTPD